MSKKPVFGHFNSQKPLFFRHFNRLLGPFFRGVQNGIFRTFKCSFGVLGFGGSVAGRGVCKTNSMSHETKFFHRFRGTKRKRPMRLRVVKVRPPWNPRNPEKFKVAQKWLKSDFQGPPQSNPKSNPKSNFLTRKVTQKWLFQVKKLLFGLLLGLLWGGDPESHFLVTFELLWIFSGFGVSRGGTLSQT